MLQLILYIIFLSITGITVFFILFNYLIHRSFHLPHVYNQKEPADYNLLSEEHFIPLSNDKKLQLWDLNPGVKAPVIIGVHGWANAASELLYLGSRLSEDWRVFLLNTRNHGKSDDVKYPSILRYKEDLIHAMDYVQHELGIANEFVLCGHSMGGAAVLLTASKDARVKAVVSISAFADMEKMIRLGFEKQKLPDSLINSMIKYVEFRLGTKLYHVSPIHSIKKYNGPVFLIHGTKDEIVDFNDMNHLIKAVGHEKISKLVMKSHTHNSPLASDDLILEINNFLKKYV